MKWALFYQRPMHCCVLSGQFTARLQSLSSRLILMETCPIDVPDDGEVIGLGACKGSLESARVDINKGHHWLLPTFLMLREHDLSRPTGCRHIGWVMSCPNCFDCLLVASHDQLRTR
jgi:hypothetical protein